MHEWKGKKHVTPDRPVSACESPFSNPTPSNQRILGLRTSCYLVHLELLCTHTTTLPCSIDAFEEACDIEPPEQGTCNVRVNRSSALPKLRRYSQTSKHTQLLNFFPFPLDSKASLRAH